MPNELKISDMLKDFGISPILRGYRYIIYSVEEMLKDQSLMYAITKRLYPLVAKQFDTTKSRVERAIRHAIEAGWEKGNMETQARLFGYTVDANRGNPSNGEFICTLADWLVLTEGRADNGNER
ncbi:MAG: sporulation initiation factor Spo0A C-terminal domain-containing protein [Clostridia bacterium]|nr:sporulation initiation factor Spo0A C-terminal domain-containing protein [Clostridia bacterium]